jgi:hypothetical protein
MSNTTQNHGMNAKVPIPCPDNELNRIFSGYF